MGSWNGMVNKICKLLLFLDVQGKFESVGPSRPDVLGFN